MQKGRGDATGRISRGLWALVFLGVGVVGFAGKGLAAPTPPGDQAGNVSLQVQVGFTFTLSLTSTNVSFAGNPGDTLDSSSSPIGATVSTNANQLWYLKISDTGALTDAGQGLTIPNGSFFHRSSCDPGSTCKGTFSDSSNAAFTTSPTIYYTAHPSEKKNLNDGGTKVQTIYTLAIPATQEAGSYATTIVHTLTVNP